MDVEEEGFDHNPAPSQNIGLGDGGDRTIGGGAGTSHATRKTMSGSSRAAEMGWRQGPRRDEVLRVLQTVVDKDFSLGMFIVVEGLCPRARMLTSVQPNLATHLIRRRRLDHVQGLCQELLETICASGLVLHIPGQIDFFLSRSCVLQECLKLVLI